MRTIDDYRAGCLVMLGDAAGRRYTNSMLDAALEEALPVYRSFCPRRETITQTVKEVDGHSLLLPPMPPGVEIQTMRIAGGEWLEFFPYQSDRWLYLNIANSGTLPPVGTQLLLTLSVPHTIRDLNEAQNTTIPDSHAGTVIKGASGYTMRIRARSVTEVFGKRPEDRAALMEQAEGMITEYFSDLARLQPATFDPIPRGEFPV